MSENDPNTDDKLRITDTMTPQEIVDAAVEHKSAAYIRENFEEYFTPLNIIGIQIHRSQVEIPDDDEAE